MKTNQTPFLLRALWFIFFGWYIAGFWILVAWFLNVTIIGLPFGLWMLNRLPQVMTLKGRGGRLIVDEKSGTVYHQSAQQPPFLIRAAYFILIGWWLSLLWAAVGYLLCLTLLGLPFGLIMLNNLPTITTLQRM